MDDILFLCHRIPYPPNKGEKIRAFNFLRELAQRYRIHLAAFVDDPADWPSRHALERYCADTLFIRQSPGLARLRGLTGLLAGRPISLPYYGSRRLSAWVQSKIDAGVSRFFAYSSAMAQFGERPELDLRVADLVDVDSEKWRQYAGESPWPWSLIYRLEARRLADYERVVASRFHLTLLVSEEERGCFLRGAPNLAKRVFAVRNGVDAEYFRPRLELDSPYDPAALPVVFTGAMGYRPNVDAVTWFARDAFPVVRGAFPSAEFWIVGAQPAPAVRALEKLEGVRVTGRVPDVRHYLRHARVAVAPLRIARGIQNKVLEAMASGCPVVCTSGALEGIDARDGTHLLVADDAAALAARVRSCLEDSGTAQWRAEAARHLVESEYSWGAAGAMLRELVTRAERGTSAEAVPEAPAIPSSRRA